MPITELIEKVAAICKANSAGGYKSIWKTNLLTDIIHFAKA